MTDQRSEQIAANLGKVRARVASACAHAGRAPDTVTLIVVTKYFSADDVRRLAALGITDVGENRHQEAAAKVAECAGLGLRWHFIGGLQSNKAAAVARYSDVVESVDRPKIVTALQRGALDRTEPLEVLVQVSLDRPDHDGRSGVRPEELLELAALVDQQSMLRLRGLMAVAPLGEPPAPAFARLAQFHDGLVGAFPQATALSAGMSADLEEAIAVGATHVRIGSAVLGPRQEFV